MSSSMSGGSGRGNEGGGVDIVATVIFIIDVCRASYCSRMRVELIDGRPVQQVGLTIECERINANEKALVYYSLYDQI